MENMLGCLHVRVKRGFNLAVRDIVTSDPYVVLQSGNQRCNTRVVRSNLNPKWNEDLALSITNPNDPINLAVYDEDYRRDDKLGDAEINIKPFMEAVKMNLNGVPSEATIKRINPSWQNCLVEESRVKRVGGELVQNMLIRLRNVERGLIEIELRWSNVRYTKDQYGFTRIDSW